ncbi:MAG: GDYXXLXY domain-containing protein [Armatimonadota bacterium]
MTRGIAVAWAVAGQVAVVGGLVAWKQVTVATGQTVLLRCEPLDPRDLLRGEYVTLKYDIGTQTAPDGAPARLGETLYLTLERDGRFHQGSPYGGVGRSRPSDATTWLAGTVTEIRPGDRNRNATVVLDFGIGTYSVPRGQGRRFEAAGWSDKTMLAATVKIDRFGRAVLRKVDVVSRDRPRAVDPPVFPAPVQSGTSSPRVAPKTVPGGSVIAPADATTPPAKSERKPTPNPKSGTTVR